MSAGPTSAAGGTRAVAGWHVVDADGRDPATGRPPGGRGAPSPAAALARVPVARWPLTLTAGGATIAVADALGPGGARVELLLDRLGAAPPPPDAPALAALARATPAGPLDLPVAAVGLAAGVGAAGAVDRAWMDVVEARREAPRRVLAGRGRSAELEAALNLGMLIGTDALTGTAGEAARMASGARLWLLAGAVAWALLAGPDDPFAAWGDLVSWGLWPIGPVDGRLVVCTP